jgi:hypothetical protein
MFTDKHRGSTKHYPHLVGRNSNNRIEIQYDYIGNSHLSSYIEVLDKIERGEELIYTLCLDFFSFYYLEKGYDVRVTKSNGDYILLSELLTDVDNIYTRKNIRKAHNVRRLLTSNSLNFKSK